MKTLSALVAIAATVLAISGCTAPTTSTSSTQAVATPEHNARNSLDWPGTYRGVLPCADCEGIETVVVLSPTGQYRAQSKYLGKSPRVIKQQGNFTWNPEGNTITFSDTPVRHFVGENQIIRLAEDGTRVTGPLAKNYVLTRVPDGAAGPSSVTETYWKLVELNGKPVPTLEREPHLILRTADQRVNGFGGCNHFNGAYELDEAHSRISFSQVASTMMACESGMDVEKAFHAMLLRVDNFSLNGNHLTLNRARMAPLARFEAVYLR